MAGTITSISPSKVKINSGEHFLTIYGSGLGTIVVFDGPGGYFERNTNANFSGSVHVWVPEGVVRKSGLYNVWVRGGTGDSNVVTFEVEGFKFFPFVIITPEILRAQPLNREGGYVKYDVFWAGGESNDGTVDCFPRSGDFFKMGATGVDCTGRNSAGETAKASFTVLVRDEIPPTVYVPTQPIQVGAESRDGAVVQYDAKADDDIYGDVLPDCSPRSGSVFPVGKTLVQCMATDFDGNTGFGFFTVEVLGEVKWYPLTVRVPDTIFADARTPEGVEVDFKVSVEGTNDPYPEITCSHKSGAVFPIGTNGVTCDAIDRYGMRGRGAFVIEVRDPKGPFIEKLYATPDTLRNDGLIYRIDLIASVTDEFDPRPVCSIYSVTSNQAIHLGDSSSDKDYDWHVVGDMTLDLRGEAVRVDRYYDIWVGCSDYYGNRTNTTTRVYVPYASGASVPSTPPKRRSGPKG